MDGHSRHFQLGASVNLPLPLSQTPEDGSPEGPVPTGGITGLLGVSVSQASHACCQAALQQPDGADFIPSFRDQGWVPPVRGVS